MALTQAGDASEGGGDGSPEGVSGEDESAEGCKVGDEVGQGAGEGIVLKVDVFDIGEGKERVGEGAAQNV